MNIVSINGLTIETSKPGVSINGSVVVFGDGSTYNTRTGAFNNAGPGYVKLNGRLLENNEGDAEKSKESSVKTRTEDFNASELSLKLASTDVSVQKWDGSGMRVELTGPSDLIDAFTLVERHGTLLVEESKSANGRGSINIDGGSITMSSFGGNSFIGGVQIGGRHGGVTIGGQGHSISMKIFVPSGTPIAVSTKGGDVDINDINGPLDVSIAGSADVRAKSASGNVNIRVAGSGDVKVNRGEVNNLNVSIAGSGDVRFGGVAQNAMLTIAGSGDISVNHVINKPMKSVAGSGDISIGKVG
jgi:hypothetical protein